MPKDLQLLLDRGLPRFCVCRESADRTGRARDRIAKIPAEEASVDVIITQRVTPSTRGLLTRWLLEATAKVLVGTISKWVSDGLCAEVRSRRGLGALTLIYRAPNEQGFAILTAGQGRRERRILTD